MYLYPLIISALAVVNPFLGLVLMLGYCAKALGICVSNPVRSLMMFFPLPIGMLLLERSTGSQMMALDAIAAVGLVCLTFLYRLKQKGNFSDAFLLAVISLFGYGLLRTWIFGVYQEQVFSQGLETIKTQLPTIVDNAMFQEAIPLWKAILPAIWVITQSLGLYVGYLLFGKLLKLPAQISSLKFPGIYNLFIIAILPLYLLEQTKMLFVNLLLTMCVVPFIQGITVVSQRLAMVFANKLVHGIFMAIIILYAHILLVLMGFADMWLNKRNEIPGGITA